MKPFLFLLSLLLLSACVTEITVDLPKGENQVVVEGYITEGGPPSVLLTRNASFYGVLGLLNTDSFFVRNAIVKVFTDTDTNQLAPYVFDTLGLKAVIYQPNFFDQLNETVILGEAGKTYGIQIEADDKIITGTTRIPHSLPIDSAWTKIAQDTLARLFLEFSDPDTLGNYYRYFTKVNNQPMYPGFSSVFDDLLINGQKTSTSIDQGYSRFRDIDFDRFGLVCPEDSVTIRLSAIDEAHYSFWSTLEANAQAGTPFSGITVVDHNLIGGFGVWGGYGVQEISILVQ